MICKNMFYLLVFFTTAAYAQNKQLLYGFSEIPQSLLLNPGGNINNKGFIGIPFLSHIHINGGSSGISIFDVFAEDGRAFNSKLNQAVNTLTPQDFFTATQQIEIFSAGFAFGNTYQKNEYLTFGAYQELDFILYFPKDYAVLALEGNQPNIGRPFKLDHLSLNADLLAVYHLGYNKKVSTAFSYGVRAKIYSSIANINSTGNNGRFLTVDGENNIFQHIFNLDLELRTSGVSSVIDDKDKSAGEDIREFATRTLLGGNLGLGIDFGFSYRLSDQLTFDASVLDIGFIRHNNAIENYELKGDFVFEGVDPIFSGTNGNQTADEFYDEIEEEFTNLFTIDTTTNKYTVWRPTKLNASINYAYGKRTSKACNCLHNESAYLNAVGAQLYAINRPVDPQIAFTVYYYRKLFNGLSVKATYTIDTFSNYNMGLGISGRIGGFNYYVLADNIFEYRNLYDAQNLSLQLGFNYIFRNNEN